MPTPRETAKSIVSNLRPEDISRLIKLEEFLMIAELCSITGEMLFGDITDYVDAIQARADELNLR